MVMSDAEHGQAIDKTLFPGIQGGPLMHVIAGKAVALGEALTPAYRRYIEQVLENAKVLAETLQSEGLRIVSGGTDNHLMLVDVSSLGMSGRKAERVLDSVGITANKNTIPGETRSPRQTSGVRLGTPAMTTRGFGSEEIQVTGRLIAEVLQHADDDATLDAVRGEVAELVSSFPLPGVRD
jgi:glycine hydroxymethyltransferase